MFVLEIEFQLQKTLSSSNAGLEFVFNVTHVKTDQNEQADKEVALNMNCDMRRVSLLYINNNKVKVLVYLRLQGMAGFFFHSRILSLNDDN